MLDTEFVALVRRNIERRIDERRVDLASGRLGNTVESIALRTTRITGEILGLQAALDAISATIKGQSDI